MASASPTIVLFDGVCVLCDGVVQFILDRDPDGRFVFAAQQSDESRALLVSMGAPPLEPDRDPEGLIVIDDGRIYDLSSAALRIARRLGAPWSFLIALILVPRPIRDLVYRYIARHRYRWFGRKTSCRVPTPEIRARFLESRPDLQLAPRPIEAPTAPEEVKAG